MNFKKIIGLFLATLLLCTLPVYANSTDDECIPYNWYFQKNKEHQQPRLDSNLKFIEDCGGYYLDHQCKDNVIYLTFDAGYENGNVEKILDALDSHQAPGAFFVLDHLIKSQPQLVKRMAAGGHLVCNHTAKHPDMAEITDRALFEKQLTALEKSYTELTGEKLAPFYRPPQGRFTKQNLCYAKDMGYKTIFWSYAYADWDNQKQPDPTWAKEEILAHTHPGMVILLHPTSETNAKIMDDLLTAWENMGYRFGSLEELTA